MHRWALLVLVVAVLAAGCGDGDGFGTTSAPSTTQAVQPTEPSTSPTTAAPDTTTMPPESTTITPPPDSTSSTTIATTTTSTAPETFYFVDTTDFFPDPFPGSSGGAHGSGCVVADFEVLPNGVWFGFAEGVGGGMITFDLACFFTGAAAEAAAAEDGQESFDFYIRNLNPVTYEVPVAADARVWYVNMLSGDVSAPTEIPLAAWPSPDSFQDCPSDYCSVWLYVNGLQVTGIVEQYLP